MSININKANLTEFKLSFSNLPKKMNFEENKNFELHIFDTLIPSFSLTPTEIPWQGGSIGIEGGGLDFGDWTTSFIIDSNFKNWLTMFQWITSINNNENNFGFESDKEYITNASLLIMNNFQIPVFTLEFENIWPTVLGDVQLSYKDGESLLSSSVSFSYDRYFVNN